MTKVSVVVCAKNEEKYIEACLKALKSQSVKPEIIVVDGHSTDKTIEIAKKYADKVVEDNKKGLSEARNIGAKKAAGEIIAFCDADSKPLKHWVRNIIKLFKNKKTLGVSGPLVSYDGDFHLKLTIRFWADWVPRFLSYFYFDNCWGANMAFRKSSLEKYPFRFKFLEDYDMGERLREINGMKFSGKMILPISSRRFGDVFGFYKICLKDYIIYTIKTKITGKRDAGYYQ